jgi:hypothetical protein
MSRGLLRASGVLVTGGMAAVAARAAYARARRRPPGDPKTWARTNHRGEPVTLLEGPAVAAAAVTAALAAPGLPARGRAALAVAGAGAAAFGGYDDLKGSGQRRGFRGHLGALAHGEVTSGAVKLAGIGATGVAAALLAGAGDPALPGGRTPGGRTPGGRTPGGAVADLVINTGLIAGGANLLNLFDLRPGRAIKVTLAAGTALGAASPAARTAVAAPLGAALALLPEDLGERAMLGDCGANALGGMLGAAAAASLPRPARVTILAAVAGLTAASEVVSFTKVIEQTPPLRWLDMLGRRPAAAAPRDPESSAAQESSPAPVAAARDEVTRPVTPESASTTAQ